MQINLTSSEKALLKFISKRDDFVSPETNAAISFLASELLYRGLLIKDGNFLKVNPDLTFDDGVWTHNTASLGDHLSNTKAGKRETYR